MQKLKTTDHSRITVDAANGAVRSFFGTDLVDAPPPPVAAAPGVAAEEVSDTAATKAFLDANKDEFKLEGVSLTP